MIQINSKAFKVYFSLLAISLLYGCSPSVEKLEIISIGKIRIDALTPEMVTLRAETTIQNPYHTSAQLKNISFDLGLTNHSIAYGKLAGSTEMKAGSTAVLNVPLAVQCELITEKDFKALFGKNVPYRIDGSAVLSRPFGPRTLPIHVQNVMDKPESLEIILNHQSANTMVSPDASGARQLAGLIRDRQLSMRFHNPFRFTVNIEGFRYEILLGKSVIADGESREAILLKPGNNRFSVTVQPHPLGIAGDLLDLLANKSIPDLTISSRFSIMEQEENLKVHLVYSPHHSAE